MVDCRKMNSAGALHPYVTKEKNGKCKCLSCGEVFTHWHELEKVDTSDWEAYDL